MSAAICYLNGRYADVRRAKILATDRGLLYGEGLFETWRTYCGRPFAVREHVARLARSARELGIPFERSENWEGRTLELVRRNRAQHGASMVRLTITRGSGPLQLRVPRTTQPTRLMLLRPLDAGLASARERGVAVYLLDVEGEMRVGLRTLKTINYLPAVIGKTAAAKHGCFEAIYRLADSTLLEGATSNLFVVKKGVFFTPAVAQGVLPGVTRAIVMRLARALGPVREEPIADTALLASDEAFLTATSLEIVPIVRAGGRKAGSGRPGPLTRELQRRYRALVARRVGMDVADLGE
jgi:D-amino acid aminotransferase